MKIIEVRFNRKINLGNYETEDIGFTATINDNENPLDVLSKLDKETLDYRKQQLTGIKKEKDSARKY